MKGAKPASETPTYTPRKFLSLIKLPIIGTSIEISGLVIVAWLWQYDNYIFTRTANSWSNFPWGIFTSIITPDTDTFILLFERNPLWWLTLSVGILVLGVFLYVWLLTNFMKDEGLMRTRARLYLVLLFLPSIVANVARLILNSGADIGPSGVQYAQIGIITGFALVNGFPVFRGNGVRANLRYARLSSLVSIVNLSLGVIILGYAVLLRDQFFTVFYMGLKVDYYTHIFTFTTPVLVLVIWGLKTRQRVPDSPFKPIRRKTTSFSEPFPKYSTNLSCYTTPESGKSTNYPGSNPRPGILILGCKSPRGVPVPYEATSSNPVGLASK